MKRQENREKVIKIPAPFIAPGSTVKPTIKEINARKEKIRRAEEIGASITKVDEADTIENPYRIQALIYINRGEEVPEKLKKQIEKFDAKYSKNVNANLNKMKRK